MVALQAIRRVVTVTWPAKAEAQAKNFLVKTAMDGHRAIMQGAMRRGGSEPDWTAYANQEGNTNLQNVVLPGPIVYRYRYWRELLLYAKTELERASPVVSGRYRSSHTRFDDGIPTPWENPVNPRTQEIFIANTVPYARRLEIGVTESGRAFIVQKDQRIYERVAKNKLIPRYRNMAHITFDYINIPKAYETTAGLPSHYFSISKARRVKRRQQKGTPIKAPAIIIGRLK